MTVDESSRGHDSIKHIVDLSVIFCLSHCSEDTVVKMLHCQKSQSKSLIKAYSLEEQEGKSKAGNRPHSLEKKKNNYPAFAQNVQKATQKNSCIPLFFQRDALAVL